MKFDFAIGNPPYQDNAIGENDTYAPPVYNKFLDAAYAQIMNAFTPLINTYCKPKRFGEVAKKK